MKLSIAATKNLESWLKKSIGSEPPAIILGSSVNALSFARSLGRRRIPTLLLDGERLLGSYTRYGEFLLLSRVEEDSAGWIDILELIASRLDTRAVLFSTTDAHCLLVSQHRDLLRQYFRFIIPDAETVERIVNKRFQYTIAQAAEIPIPKTYFPESLEEARHLSPNLTYPCILKPYISHTGRRELSNKKVRLVDSQTELISAFERLMASGQSFMIQEIIPGEDSALYGYLAFWNAEGEELAWLTTQKLRQNPPHYGDGSLQITVEAPEVARLSRRLLRTFNYSGFVGVEFKFDARDPTYRLMEINPRTFSYNQLAISAGIDFPWIGYRYLTDSMPEPLPAYSFKPGVKCVNEEWDIQAYFALRRSGALSLRQWLGSLRGAKLAIGAWDDPLPLFAGFRRLLKISWHYLRSAIGRFAEQK
ncbi:MAG: ATP-grasp domain-containing protein [Blastocatellia bacterium]|nr:ATP-grasp domain-containing protein [Blastocatellia bacterium]